MSGYICCPLKGSAKDLLLMRWCWYLAPILNCCRLSSVKWICKEHLKVTWKKMLFLDSLPEDSLHIQVYVCKQLCVKERQSMCVCVFEILSNICKYFNLHWPLVEIDWSCTWFTECPVSLFMRKMTFSILFYFMIPLCSWSFPNAPSPFIFFCNSDSLLYYFVILFPLTVCWSVFLPSQPSLPFSFFSPSRFLAIQHLLAGTVKFKVHSFCIQFVV